MANRRALQRCYSGRSVTEEVLLIDLAVGLPKESRLYYDWHHFTNAGAKEVATILAKELEPFLKSRMQID